MLPVIQGAAEFFPDHGTACPKVGLGMVCVFLELKVLLSSGLASQRVHGQVPWLGALGMSKCIPGTPKGPQSLASFIYWLCDQQSL